MASSPQQAAAALRMLAAWAIEEAQSGHPGAPLGLADLTLALFSEVMRHNPADPQWPDRDRFVLSNGHASMLHYAALHLSGYPLSMKQLRAFRTPRSITPGHPEAHLTPGVEVTTGPLGQGLAHAVGLALAERQLAQRFAGADGTPLFDHRTWVIAGDGCLMEGVSQEAISLAGVQRLGKLVVMWDDNGITIDGPLQGWFGEDVPARFASAGWRVLPSLDGHDYEAAVAALRQAAEDDGRPTLLPVRTKIGFGMGAREGQASAHSGALGEEGLRELAATLDWPHGPFEVPEEIYQRWRPRQGGQGGEQAQARWRQRLDDLRTQDAEAVAELDRCLAGELPQALEQAWPQLFAQMREAAPTATRKALTQALEATAPLLPELIGGAADLSESCGCLWSGAQVAGPDSPAGNYLHYGVREGGMTAAMGGMLQHGGVRAYGGTFLCFSDYARPSVRVAALTRTPTILVYTHDSLLLGEDGPTHQPVEHLAGLRAMPNLDLWRPCDSLETAVAWRAALWNESGPTALVLSRQSLPQAAAGAEVEDIARGCHALTQDGGKPGLVVVASGSEVGLALQARQTLADPERVRVLSMPCAEELARQPREYLEQLFPAGAPVLAVELAAPSALPIPRHVHWFGLQRFGASGKGPELLEFVGFTADKLGQRMQTLLDDGE